MRPRRSVLYMPASNQRALEKARTLAADCLVFDLEDSVAVDRKSVAREQCVAAIKIGGYGSREVIVRVNNQKSSYWEEDVVAVARSGADAICLSKVEAASEVEEVVVKLNSAGAPSAMSVWVMIETPMGVLNAHQIVAHPRVNVVVMGTTDLAKELRVPHTSDRIGLLSSLGFCLLAARACDVEILDGVYLDLNDEIGFERACRQGRELGFDGKTLIHPKQLLVANEVFGPSTDELVWAKKITEAWAVAQAEGKGVILVDGILVEAMHIDEAIRQLAIADYLNRAD